MWERIRQFTWPADAIQIWIALPSTLSSIVVFVAGLLEGWGVTLSFLFALGALPLAFVSCVLFRHWREAISSIRSFFGSQAPSAPRIGLSDTSATINHRGHPVGDNNEIPPGYDDLLAFFLAYLEPMVNAHRALYQGIITAGVPNDMMRNLALGRISDEDLLYSSFSFAAAKMAGSPAERLSFYELTTAIHNSEFTYHDAIAKRDAIAHSLGLEIKSDPQLFELWEDWRVKHNALVVEYETIKRDQRFGRLFRPIRESKWGGSIPPSPQAEPTGNRPRRDTSRRTRQ